MNLFELIIKSKSFDQFVKLVEFDKLSHAYLIYSPDEEYNEIFSKLIALKLNCEKVCFDCASCVKILNNTHPDVLIYPKNKNFVVEDSEKINDEINVLPMLSQYKIFIINNFNKATIQAQNKLLKILEEPPKNVLFILNATNLNSVLPTIMSRVQQIELSKFDKKEIITFADKNNLDLNGFALDDGDGWPCKTLKQFKDANFEKNNIIVQNILQNMKTSKDVVKFTNEFSQKEGFEERLNILEKYFDNLLIDVINNKNNEYTKNAIAQIFCKINQAKKQLQANCNLSLIGDCLLMGILEVKYYASK